MIASSMGDPLDWGGGIAQWPPASSGQDSRSALESEDGGAENEGPGIDSS